MKRILVVGSANLDLVVAAARLPRPGETLLGGSFATHLGGKGANQAVAAARAGGSVRFLGAIGRDEPGTRLRAGLAGEGIDLTHLSEVDGPSGVALITTVAGGDNTIVVAAGANGELGAGRIDEAAFRGVGLVLTQLETPLDGIRAIADISRARGATLILDPAPAATLPRELLSKVDWLTPNEGEARALLGRDADDADAIGMALALRDRGAAGVVLTMGARGVVLLDADGEPRRVDARPVEAIDTTAAGDAFNGAFAVALSEGAEPEAAVEFAITAASIAVSRNGAQAAMPRRDEIEALRGNP